MSYSIVNDIGLDEKLIFDFGTWLKEMNVIGLGVGALVATNTMSIGSSITDALVMPIVQAILQRAVPQFKIKAIISPILTFVVTMAVVFLLMRVFKVSMSRPVDWGIVQRSGCSSGLANAATRRQTGQPGLGVDLREALVLLLLQQHHLGRRRPHGNKRDVLLESLMRFYLEPANLERFTLLTGPNSPVSLRLLDWFVTNYSKSRNIVYQVVRDGVPTAFNVFTEYKAVLRAYSKRFCDPFCRRDRIAITNSNGERQYTTVAQMCFFRWAMQNNVLGYAQRHKGHIEADMLAVSKRARSVGTPAASPSPQADSPPAAAAGSTPSKRRELSTAAVKACTKSYCHVTVIFT
ncbi:hypothetical protein OEZ85_011023 [Tetradesmus obliquus]|uniref:Uncharacterized protein n=1 Tax=Tetradesmus obliquus TaxID=3088 RepID=A0ABY8TPD1_TETOB|nr:hypothetical protein OEZ85_011023 [Tetradesmus obliquus]